MSQLHRGNFLYRMYVPQKIIYLDVQTLKQFFLTGLSPNKILDKCKLPLVSNYIAGEINANYSERLLAQKGAISPKKFKTFL